jgi:diguanylate cyclase (GGDEF)-like protein
MAQAVGDNASRLEAMVAERTEKLERLAQIDPLTGILNRRGFGDAFRREQARPEMSSSLLLVDLDAFKQVNDRFGHQGGDDVILAVVARMTALLGAGDVCARWGGDEFALLVAAGDVQALSEVAERIVSAVASAPIALQKERSVSVTVSVGGCVLTAGESLSSATMRADAELYRAKRAGRNRASIAQERKRLSA